MAVFILHFHLFIYLFVYLFVCLFICLFIYLFIHSFIYLFIYLFIFWEEGLKCFFLMFSQRELFPQREHGHDRGHVFFISNI